MAAGEPKDLHIMDEPCHVGACVCRAVRLVTLPKNLV